MRRLIFFLLLTATIGASLIIVLFLPGFWSIGTSPGSYQNLICQGDIIIVGGNVYFPTGFTGGTTGFDLLWDFFANLSSYPWAFDAMTVTIFTLIIFVLFCVSALLTLFLILLVNLGNLNRSRSLYRNAVVFFVGAILITGAYIWLTVDIMNSSPLFTWTSRTLPWMFYIPFSSGLLISIFAAIFRSTENR